MELTKKTTIHLPITLYQHLARLASQRGASLGELVRQACVQQYGLRSEQERLAAVDELEALELPVGSVAEMKRESAPDPSELLP